MKDGLTSVLTEHEESLLEREKIDWARDTITARASLVKGMIPGWVDALFSASVVVGRPKVLRVRARYEDNMTIEDRGLFVAIHGLLNTTTPEMASPGRRGR